MSVTTVVIERATGLVCGLFSDHRFYYDALSKSQLGVHVLSNDSASYTVLLVHGPTHMQPKLEDLLDGTNGRYLVSKANLGYFGEPISILYTDKLGQCEPEPVKTTCTKACKAADVPFENAPAKTEPKVEPKAETKPVSKVEVVEEMPDGAAVKRRGRPPGAKNRPTTKEDLFDDTNFDTAPATTAKAPEPVEVVVDKEVDDATDYGDENEDGDPELPIISEDVVSVTSEDVRTADPGQLVAIAKRLNITTHRGMTAGQLRKQILENLPVGA